MKPSVEAVFRFRYAHQGGHVHVRVFTAPGDNLTFAKNGDLVFSVEEWASARAKLSRVGQMFDDNEVGV